MDARRRAKLAPLEPNAFLRWAYDRLPDEHKGVGPLTIDDVWFELAHRNPLVSREYVRREYVHLAALVRRNQRLGLPALEGIA